MASKWFYFKIGWDEDIEDIALVMLPEPKKETKVEKTGIKPQQEHCIICGKTLSNDCIAICKKCLPQKQDKVENLNLSIPVGYTDTIAIRDKINELIDIINQKVI